MPKAYYWYRSHPNKDYEKFCEGMELNVITSPKILVKYPDFTRIRFRFPDLFSPHGLSMLYEKKWPNESNKWHSDFQEPVTELIFELYRQAHYPDAVSRLSCLYASKTLDDAERWRKVFQKHLSDRGQIAESLWEIEYGGECEAASYDAQFLNVPPKDGFSFVRYIEYAEKYWSGVCSSKPLMELLVPYPVVVSHLVRKL